MRCDYCNRRLRRRTYYYNNNSCCFNCFEDLITEDEINFYINDPTGVADLYLL